MDFGAACRLAPGASTERCGPTLVATGPEPWLEVCGLDFPQLSGRLIELTYRSSLLDDPARPVFRFASDDGSAVDYIGAAPTAGAGVWIGRVPAHARQFAISPTNRPGPFTFWIESLRVRAWPALLLKGIRGRPRQTISAVLTRCIGWAPESDSNLMWATSATDDGGYDKWLARRARSLEVGGIDRPRVDWATAGRITVAIRSTGEAGALASTLASLDAQAFPHWDALIVGGSRDAPATPRSNVITTDLEGAVRRLGGDAGAVVLGPIDAGDVLPPYALAFLTEQRRRSPAVRMFYGDEVAAGRPVLKPGWSPRLLAIRPYLGRAIIVTQLDGWSPDQRRAYIAAGRLPPFLAMAPGDLVRPLRRVLLATPQPFTPRPIGPGGSPPSMQPRPMSVRAAIIILTCDQPALIARVVASVRAKTPAGSYRMFIVDNGHADGPAATLLSRWEQDADIVLLRRSGRFTFSGFCNEAVAVSDEPLLVFLNDDTEVLSDAWLDRMAAHVSEERVGAVGAKLTFADGRLQHVGVLVGMGGSAGHLGATAPGDDPGWMARNEVVHEVSAVTGACLAVARDKFLAVGGFDATHLPVELSDIDLCLKLKARGWQTIIDPHVHLLHEESASRGGARLRRLDVYGEQRAVFAERWRHVLRDDPTFHPGLSLYSLKAALG